MHALILLGLLGAAAVPAPERSVVVESHPLANPAQRKAAHAEEQQLQEAFSLRSRNTMGARLRADGSIEYGCEPALGELRDTERRIHEEH